MFNLHCTAFVRIWDKCIHYRMEDSQSDRSENW